MNESMLLSQIIKALYPWVHLYRANVGTVKTDKGYRFSTGLPKGFSDLFGTLPASKSKTGCATPVFIECKIGGGTLRPEQEKFLAAEKANGSIVGVAYTVEQAVNLIRPHLR